MSQARLLAVALLIGSVTGLAQVGPKGNAFPGGNAFVFASSATVATASEPWRLIPSQPMDVSSEGSALNRFRIDDYRISRSTANGRVRLLRPDPDAGMFDSIMRQQQDTDTTCYSIRSYVVARDSKDPDSTHPAGYSTCQPTDRYRLKSTEIRVESPDR